MIGDYEWWLTAAEDDKDPIAVGVGEFVRWEHDLGTCGERGAQRRAPSEDDDMPTVYARYEAWCAKHAAPIATAAVFARIFDRLSGPGWWNR